MKPSWRIAVASALPRRDHQSVAHGAEAMLRRIAQAIGEPEEAFLEGETTDGAISGATELLRVWDQLESAVDRRKLLAFARRLADRS
jgi:hypothetical protein